MAIAYFMRSSGRISEHYLYLYIDEDPRNDGYLGNEFFQFRVSPSVKDEIKLINETHKVYLNIEALRITLDSAGIPNDNFLDSDSIQETLDISSQPWEAISPNILTIERVEDD